MFLYRKIVPETIRKKISYLMDKRFYYKKAEESANSEEERYWLLLADSIEPYRVIKYKYPNKRFMVIRRASRIEGHCSMLNVFLGHLYDCQNRGLIPVIDMKNCYSSIWQAPCRKGKDNAWEYFYKQPSGFNLRKIRFAKNIEYCDPKNSESNPWIILQNQHDKKIIQEFHEIFERYIHFNPETRKYIDGYMEKLQISSRRVLGVSIRRGIEWGYLVDHWGYKHYRNIITLQNYCTLIREKLAEWNCEYVFVSIDDEEGLEILKEEFGNKLLYIDRSRQCLFKNGIPIPKEEEKQLMLPDNPQAYYEKELAYLTEVYIMGKCTSLISSPTSGNVTSMIINGNEYEKIYSL